MKYFIDFEFIEGFNKPLFGKRRHFIDMISVGIACEDGRNFTRISSEYNYNDADGWVKDNVIIPLYISTVHGDIRNRLDASDFHKFYGLPNKMIAEEVVKFVQAFPSKTAPDLMEYDNNIEFYGYYADYDWVLFCSLFGRMIDLPKGFPMYCKDLKQMLDEKVSINQLTLETIKTRSDYPQQENEHNALSDARWNKELYKFIKNL